ncbi:MAG: class I SAM-dependent methyltransferase [Planctomycetes bacterium]|nr:class I SAM-dependent methyltransferase [Planctomycetota bacterium]
MQLSLRSLACLVLLSAGLACRSGPQGDEAPRAYGDVRSQAPARLPSAQQRPAQPKAAPAELAPPAADAARATEATRLDAHPHHGAPTNRDPKGQRDVEKYIEMLESKEREKELRIDVVIAKLELPRNAVIGDLGCGPGLFTMAFAAACPEGLVYASDLEPAQIDRVRGKVEQRGLRNVVPVLAGAQDPHFPLASLDVVFLADTYHHLEDRIAYFKRLKDVLKPEGRLVVLDYKPGKLPVGPPPEHKLPEGLMNKELERAGYLLIDRFNTHAFHDFEVWRPRRAWERGE